MKILVTGANGFIGKNLIADLKNRGYGEIFPVDLDTPSVLLDEYICSCGFIFHLAGTNRPEDPNEFMKGNFDFTATLLQRLKENHSNANILFTSSIQSELDNDYGRSKKATEDLLFKYGEQTNCKVLVYRLPNVFGKWCKPNYNSVIATFCHNIANELPIQISDFNHKMTLVYIDDVVAEFCNALEGRPNRQGVFCKVEQIYDSTLGEIATLINKFRQCRAELSIPDMSNELIKKLYSTYLSYLPDNQFGHLLKMNIDERGSFTEIIKTPDRGQFSINISKPGITKGEHWHHTKNEKFVVVSGQGTIRLRKVGSQKVIEYQVSGEKMQVIDIPAGYTHSIINKGNQDMATFMWCSECFDAEHSDTFFMEVGNEWGN